MKSMMQTKRTLSRSCVYHRHTTSSIGTSNYNKRGSRENAPREGWRAKEKVINSTMKRGPINTDLGETTAFFFFVFFFFFLALHPQLMEVPRLGIQLEL